ncbi:hypothetical protein EW026_g214 [Hermanssonia centrifuga]|uniref:Zinc finger ZPR1-type domain-containing protein n=1 Tax=Hermanssonia centrifuga TaxID=98765 RepID=A0A4S4KV65_9APHY|nr:hypothetical protein EW026_g214 [Hermanssonia centrifuga]
MSFRCEHCGFNNNEIQSAGTIRPEGTVYTARIMSRDDLDRQLVKSETCSVTIPEFELTIPPNRGSLTIVEGLLRDVMTDLSLDQPLRRIENEATYNKIETIINGIKEILADEEEEGEEEDKNTVGPVKVSKASKKDVPMKPFTVILDDPTGNSFIEFVGSMADPKWNLRTYRRTRQQNIDLSLINPDEEPEPERRDEEIGGGFEGQNEEIYIFPGSCSSCGHPSDTLVKKVNIPYFKDILIMSVNCDKCGYRDNEVKSGSAISAQGKKITLKVTDREDLSRDILKARILNQVYEELSVKVFNDAKTDDGAFGKFLVRLKEVKSAENPFTVILDDPLADSYVQNLYAPDPDPEMTIEVYDRTWEQNEELGLNDMQVEGYEGDPMMEANKEQKGAIEKKDEPPS